MHGGKNLRWLRTAELSKGAVQDRQRPCVNDVRAYTAGRKICNSRKITLYNSHSEHWSAISQATEQRTGRRKDYAAPCQQFETGRRRESVSLSRRRMTCPWATVAASSIRART